MIEGQKEKRQVITYMSIYESLNPMQREAVLSTEGPLLVLAGAGSGKTRVLTHRVAYLIEEMGVAPWNIMAITFTNKTAGELKDRLCSMLGDEEGKEVFASTFHSACVRILRRYAEEIGWPRSFTIYDTDDAQRVMKAIYKEQSVDDKFFQVKAALNQIGRWKDQLIDPAEAAKESVGKTKLELAAKLYGIYEKRLHEAGAFDFDGLI